MSEDLIIDCDTGSDDAIALLVGALHRDLNLIAVTTVAGNCPIEVTTLNTLKVLDSAEYFRESPCTGGRTARSSARSTVAPDGPSIWTCRSR